MTVRGADLSKFANPSGKQTGPHGRVLCLVCGTEVPKSRQKLCSAHCTALWREETDWDYARELVFERDKGICQVCTLDLTALLRQRQRELSARFVGRPDAELERAARASILADWNIRTGKRLAIFDVDHILAVSEGGDNRHANLRTVCIPCHRQLTRLLRRRLK